MFFRTIIIVGVVVTFAVLIVAAALLPFSVHVGVVVVVVVVCVHGIGGCGICLM